MVETVISLKSVNTDKGHSRKQINITSDEDFRMSSLISRVCELAVNADKLLGSRQRTLVSSMG